MEKQIVSLSYSTSQSSDPPKWSSPWLSVYELARLAYRLRGTTCPICGYEWFCGQDVKDREPVFDGTGLGTCSACLLDRPVDQLVREHFDFCSEADGLTDNDRLFLSRIAVTVEQGEFLDQDDCHRLYTLYSKLKEKI